ALEDVVLKKKRGSLFPARNSGSAQVPHLIDAKVLQEDFQMLGLDKTGRMIEAFRTSTPHKCNALMEAVAICDLEKVRHIAHSMKGASAHLGLVALETLSKSIEQAAERTNSDTVKTLSESYPKTYKESLAALDEIWAFFTKAEEVQETASISSLKR
ncbi:MAG: Hpt domain-containing protein, partial [Kiloniellales bacterium]|nr:Hpt domain-containing protein [Kiloniellales bacterium]